MTFSAREIAAGLVDGKVVFRTGEMDRGNQPEKALVCFFESRFAGRKFPLFGFNKTVPLRISLSD